MPSASELREVFSLHLPAGARPIADPGELDALLAKWVAEARLAWPDVAIEPETFVAYVAERAAPAPGASLETLRATHASDLYLACGCAAGSPAALRAFETAFARHVEAVLRKVPDVRSASNDIEQIVREKLSVAAAGAPPKIAEYEGKSPLRTWLRVVTTRVAIDQLRGVRPAAPGGDDAVQALPAAANDPELTYVKQRHAREFSEAFRDAAAELSPQERNLLRQHYGDGLTLDQLAAQHRVHRVTLARRLAAARDKLAAATRRLLLQRFGVGSKELESLMQLVRSQFDVSVRTLLPSSDGGDA